MSFRVVYGAEATFEFQEAVEWYENQTGGLGVRFILEVDVVIAAISSTPFQFPNAGFKARRARVLGWPY